MTIKCGFCGQKLDRLGTDHTCVRGIKVAAAMVGNVEPILNDD